MSKAVSAIFLGIMPSLFGLIFFGLAHADELVLYAHDSFMAKGGLGKAIIPLFEKKYGCKVTAPALGDAAQVVARLELDAKRGKPVAHVVVGIDDQLWPRVKSLAWKWKQPLKGYGDLKLGLARDEGFVPYDHGYLGFIVDTQELSKKKIPVPRKLRDLLKPEWKRNFILEDPRTSTPGLGFLLFSKSVEKDRALEFWKSLKGQPLAILPGWDSAYGLFLKGEAPMVWSYLTSQAYHEMHGDKEHRYRAVVFEEGNPEQVEGAVGIQASIKNPKQEKLVREFLEFMLTREVQALIPTTQWMLPAVKGIELPSAFSSLPQPIKTISLRFSQDKGEQAVSQTVSKIIEQWSTAISGR